MRMRPSAPVRKPAGRGHRRSGGTNFKVARPAADASAPPLRRLGLPIAGTATAAIAIPNALGLVGRTFFQQVAALELDAAGGLLAVTTTNALAQTVGAL